MTGVKGGNQRALQVRRVSLILEKDRRENFKKKVGEEEGVVCQGRKAGTLSREGRGSQAEGARAAEGV